MAKSLVIVESPAKASTINKFLGRDFTVKASMGHVRDLPKKTLGVDEQSFEPEYEEIGTRAKVLGEIRKAAKRVEQIYIATDPDREGEAIGWHLAQVLDPEQERTQRVTFNEITQRAVREAFEHPSRIDVHKVDAQQTRRILDRLVGYKLSPLLWDKVRRGLSAGRVQSVALRIVVDREREIAAFEPEEYWLVEAQLDGEQPPRFKARLLRHGDQKLSVSNGEQAQSIREHVEAAEWRVLEVERKRRKRNPQPPFITSKLQQDAARQLRFSVKKTMSVAQRLYEGVNLGSAGQVGLITYMRTDSTRVAGEALGAVRQHIAATYGEHSLPARPRSFGRKKAAQDAHEAIRPTSTELPPEAVREHLGNDEYRLYRLIWNRFVASQMNPAVYDQTVVDIQAGEYVFRASGSVLREPGYLAVYRESSERDNGDSEDADVSLPALEAGQLLTLHQLDTEQKFTQPPPRFTEASLVKELEDNGIGRPSTYASILATLQNREYTVKEEGRFRPSELGILITDLLLDNFADILDLGYTARLESKLDAIEAGEAKWRDMLGEFNRKFQRDLERAAVEMRDVKREEIPTDENCERCGSQLVKKWGRFGSFLACSNYPECKFTKEVAPQQEQAIPETEPCENCGAEMVSKRGRFGPFLACSNYPECKTTRKLVKDAKGGVRAAKDTLLDTPCPECGKPLARKHGRFGEFTACSNYPECRYIQRKDTGVSCPREGCKGSLVERRSRRGKVFYGCSVYPDCDYVVWNQPIPEACPKCGAPFLLERRTKRGATRYCESKECDHKQALKTDAS